MSDDLELKRLIEIFGREEVEEAAPFEPDADFWQQVEIWQRADEENEPARMEADARAARELDELVERLRNEPDL